MTAPTGSVAVIEELRRKLKDDAALAELLHSSLDEARSIAKGQLDDALYRALSWPEDEKAYLDYLAGFAKWKPQQSGADAWLKPGTDEHQEVYDRLCHFYWLIDQKVGGNDARIVENDEWFKMWLVRYADAWGEFLDSTESFDRETLESFCEFSPEFRVQDSMFDGRPNSPSGWLTFNQFFARELNPGLRPIASPADNLVVTAPADCTFRNLYPIHSDSAIPDIKIKKTHSFANVKDLLKGSDYGDVFANGTFAHYFLGPYSYHRFHAPVAGLLRECYAVKGLVYLDVKLKDNQFDAPDSAEGGYEFSQARGIVILDTTNSAAGDVGIVGIVPVGMCQVSSVNMTAVAGNDLQKGEEFGYFLFGGSDIIVLFQEGVNPDMYTGGQYRHYGTPIATCARR